MNQNHETFENVDVKDNLLHINWNEMIKLTSLKQPSIDILYTKLRASHTHSSEIW